MQDEHLAVPFCRSDSLCVYDTNPFGEPIGIINLLQLLRLHSLAFQQCRCLDGVMNLTAGNNEP